jgi:hypothetical protein
MSRFLRIAAACLTAAGFLTSPAHAQDAAANDRIACLTALHSRTWTVIEPACQGALSDIDVEGAYRIVPQTANAYAVLLRDADLLTAYGQAADRASDSWQAYRGYQGALRLAYRLVRGPLAVSRAVARILGEAHSIIATTGPRVTALSAHVPRTRCVSQPAPDGFVFPAADPRGYVGTLAVTMSIDKDGNVSAPRLSGSLENVALDKAVLVAARRSSYEPVDACGPSGSSAVYVVLYDPAWPADLFVHARATPTSP